MAFLCLTSNRYTKKEELTDCHCVPRTPVSLTTVRVPQWSLHSSFPAEPIEVSGLPHTGWTRKVTGVTVRGQSSRLGASTDGIRHPACLSQCPCHWDTVSSTHSLEEERVSLAPSCCSWGRQGRTARRGARPGGGELSSAQPETGSREGRGRRGQIVAPGHTQGDAPPLTRAPA